MRNLKSSLLWFYLSLIFLALSFLLSLVSEVKFPFETFHFIYWQAILVLISWGCFYFAPSQMKKSFVRVAQIGIGLIVFLFLVNSILRVIDVYSLGQNGVVQDVCKRATTICSKAVLVFYKAKIFRFITLSSLFFIQAFCSLFGMILISYYEKSLPVKKISHLQLAFFFFFFFPLLAQFEMAFAKIHSDTVQTIQALPLSFEDRFVLRMGGLAYEGWIQPYAKFIIENTEPTATILIPPQENTWAMVGNEAYLRWFVFPRKLVHLDENGQVPPDVEYILIAQGDCRFGDCGWPKFPISKVNIQAIHLIDRKTLDKTVLYNQDYVVQKEKEEWGVIQLKKGK
jgi:hypothetical protein